VDPSGDAPASNASLFPFVPGIEVVGASIASCFRASYSVEFTVPHFVRTGWIIQEIRSELEIVTCEGKDVTTKVDKRYGHYWEACDISEPPPGLTDTFARAGSLWNTRGFYAAHGMAKGAGNVPLPETFIVGTVPEAGPIPSTYLKPWGWDYLQGAEHSMKITWDCCCKPPCVLMHTDPKWSVDLPVGPDTRPGCPQQVPIYDINEH
jgi:hypothetical protein